MVSTYVPTYLHGWWRWGGIGYLKEKKESSNSLKAGRSTRNMSIQLPMCVIGSSKWIFLLLSMDGFMLGLAMPPKAEVLECPNPLVLSNQIERITGYLAIGKRMI